MRFKIVEGAYVDFESIREEFTNDYLHSGIPNKELQKKYGLTKGEWNEFTSQIKEEFNLTRRPRKFNGRYYYRKVNGWNVSKRMGTKTYNFGTVPTEEIAQLLVEKCKEVDWDIAKCYKIVQSWEKYVEK